MIKDNDLKYWLAISRMQKIGASRFKKIYNFFPDMKTAWLEADMIDFLDAGWDEKIAQEFIIFKKNINPDKELDKLFAQQIQAVTIFDDNYPALLKQIYNPPALLYYRGEIEKINEFSIAVVGTRKISEYGKIITTNIVSELAQNKITIVSGLALGLDALAHLTATQNKTLTVAVLGSGIDDQSIYPSSNRGLAQNILQNNGLIVSEYPLGTLPQKHNFPMRNRIISGLSLGTLVIEAGEISGALITAKFALEQNREVFAVPGNITSLNSQGTNNLIKQGAQVVTSAKDILEALNLKQVCNFQKNREILTSDPTERTILDNLTTEPIHIDLLAKKCALPVSQINATLTVMELKGQIRKISNNRYFVI